jgi:ABC-2 type transport system ATP-binding protein
MIEVENITKRYGATIAVNNVSFQARAGEIVGFLGPNGAGKSTTIKILTCYIVADAGRVQVAGYDVLESSLEVRRRIGYLPESTALYLDMRVKDYLGFIADVRRIPSERRRGAIDRVVQLTGIERMLKKNIGHLSKGYRQRVGLSQALIHDPPILILDEPTSGLDPHQIIEIRQLIQELGRSKLVLFSSHILQEISAICTRLLVIRDGRLVANGTPQELMRRSGGGRLYRLRVQGAAEQVESRLRALAGVASARGVGGQDGYSEFEVQSTAADGNGDLAPELFRAVKDNGWTLARLQERERSLEDVYLELTARR